MEKPTYAELLDLLDNVSATAENMLPLCTMTESDRTNRTNLIKMARMICDRDLRNEGPLA